MSIPSLSINVPFYLRLRSGGKDSLSIAILTRYYSISPAAIALARPRLTCSLLMQQHLEGVFHRAGECDGSGVHEEDLVYLVDGVQAVRDDDLGSLRGELGQNLF